MTRKRMITFHWKWDEDLTISMEMDYGAHHDRDGAIHYAEIMINPQVKNFDDWVLVK